MQNFNRSQTRLAFIQYIFQSEFTEIQSLKEINEFQKHFYNSNISVIGESKEFKLKFNKNFLQKLSENYIKNFPKEEIIQKVNNFITSERKFEKWNAVLKSLLFASISEIQITEQNKLKIIINDYINISKSLVSFKETKLLNAIIQKILDEK